ALGIVVLAADDFGDAEAPASRSVVGLIMAKRHDQLRNTLTKHLPRSPDTGLMYNAGGFREHERERRVFKSDNIFIQAFWRLIIAAIKQQGPSSEYFCGLSAFIEEIAGSHHSS